MDEFSSIENDLWNNSPHFHIWDGVSTHGGFDKECLEFLQQNIINYKNEGDRGALSFLETGAGLSTLLFLLGDFKVYSFCMADVLDRISDYLTVRKSSYFKNWNPYPGYNEFTLPQFAERNRSAMDIALIDGNHAVGSCFVDYFYSNYSLKQGGLLIIDDNQLPGPAGVSRLIDWLSNDYIFVAQFRKIRVYKKISNNVISCANMEAFLWA
jgi:hypothetical protein